MTFTDNSSTQTVGLFSVKDHILSWSKTAILFIQLYNASAILFVIGQNLQGSSHETRSMSNPPRYIGSVGVSGDTAAW